MKVYVVTSGTHSDYRIEAIFKKKKDAEALDTALSGGYGVEEWEVNKQRIVPLWSIWMKRNGELNDYYAAPYAYVGKKEYTCCYSDGVIHFEIQADTLERAIEVANKRRIMIIGDVARSGCPCIEKDAEAEIT